MNADVPQFNSQSQLPDSRCVDKVRLSPNHGARRQGQIPDMLILHYTGMLEARGMDGAERAIRWLCDPNSQVSCHYVVAEDGEITQLVPEARRAWHAGVSYWAGESDINSVSIGIEIVNPGHPWDLARAPDAPAEEPAPVHPGYRGFPDVQIVAVTALAADVVSRYRIPPARVLAHSDVAPSRKRDPGEKFPWKRLADAGVGLMPSAVEDVGNATVDGSINIAAMQEKYARLGYRIDVNGLNDRSTVDVVIAFQRHWRPARVDGVADPATLAMLDLVLASASSNMLVGGLA